MKKFAALFFFLAFAFSGQAQWVVQNSPNFTWATPLIDIKVVNANTVWAATPYQRVAKTTNGGASWSAYPVNDPNFLNLNIVTISAVDANTAWVGVLIPYTPPSNLTTARIYRTSDGGLTWQHQSSAFPNVSKFIKFLHFFDANNGVALADMQNGTSTTGPNTLDIITTSNGGVTWQSVPATNIPGLPGTFTTATTFANTIWFMDTNRQLYKSADKGLNWTTADPGFPAFNSQVMSLAFCDNQNGLAYFNGQLKKSTDGGNSWSAVNPAGNWFNEKIVGIPGTNSFIGISSAMLASGSAVTHDFGNTWQVVEYIFRHYDVDFLDSGTGYSGGPGYMYKFNGNILSSGIEKTNDASFKVYSDPEAGTFTISGQSNVTYNVAVYDVTGKSILEQKENVVGLHQLNLSGKPKGIYLLHILSGKQHLVKKIIL